MIIQYGNNKALIERKEKVTLVASEDFNHILDKVTGASYTWGRKKEDDPEFSPFGPLIADIEVTTICGGPNGKLCPMCFPKDVKIKTTNGEKYISDIKIGDIVYSYDERNEKIITNEVLEIYERMYNGNFIIVELEDGTKLKMTENHQVFIKNVGWVPANKIEPEMEIIKI